MPISRRHLLTTLACLLVGCRSGLVTSTCAVAEDGGTGTVPERPAEPEPPALLGPYGRPCGVLGNTQWPRASFSPSGDVIALTAGGPGHVELRATGDGHLVTAFDAHLGPLPTLAFSPTENLLATGGIEGSVKLWRGGVVVAQQQVFPRPVAHLVWSHDGASLAVASQLGPLVVLRVEGAELRPGWRLDGDYRGGQPSFSPDDELLTWHEGGPGDSLHVLSTADGTPMGSGMLADDRYLIAESFDGSLVAYVDRFFQQVTIVRQGRLLWQRGFFGAQRTHVAFTPDARHVAIWGGTAPTPVELFDVDNGNLVGTLSWANNSASAIIFSPDGRWALVFDLQDEGGAARLVELGAGASLTLGSRPERWQGLGGPVSVSADGAMMAGQSRLGGGSFDTAVELWNLQTREHVAQIPWSFFSPFGVPALSARGGIVYGLEYAPDGANGATLSGVRIDSLAGPAMSTRWPLDGFTQTVALAHDERTLAIARYVSNAEWRIYLIDWVTRQAINDFSIGPRPTTNLVFSADGRQLVATRSDTFAVGTKDFSVWRIADGKLLLEAGDHEQAPRGASFSPDGTMLLVFGDGGANRAGLEVYDATRWTWLRTLERSDNPRASIHFSADGRHLAVASTDGIHVWRTSDWQRYETFGTTIFADAVFMPSSQDVLELATGVVWCGPR